VKLCKLDCNQWNCGGKCDADSCTAGFNSVGCKFKKNAALSMSLVYITMMGLLIVSARLSNMKGYVVLFMLGFFWVAAICTFLFQHGLASLTHMLFVLVLG
jgi:hypothetical protein